ncbi:MAG: DMT family transporter [Gammaproteobacteria bacterium]|nr:DMT family transporter [Gammaproteobacteria bacterium]
MLAASLLFSIMNACVFGASQADPAVPAAVVSFIRVVINLSLLLIPALFTGGLLALFGDLRPSLWWRGIFGATALMLSFAAIARIGAGEAAFLHSSSGVFLALLSPLVLGQRSSAGVWLAIGGSLAGLALLLSPHWNGDDRLGPSMALASGGLAALAYLMVARSGRSNPPSTVVFYFCLVGVFLHLVFFTWTSPHWPRGAAVWLWILGSGVAATGAQLLMTRAYQHAPAALLGAVGYTGPVFSLAWDMLLFGQRPGPKALLGCALVLVCGMTLPFLIARAQATRGALPEG